MFKHILLPTDGSASSEETIRRGLEFASIVGASVTGFHVAEERLPTFAMQDVSYSDPAMVDLMENYDLATAIRALSFVECTANDAGVDCTCYCTRDHSIPESIVKVARERECDLIWMASGGKRGFPGFFSESKTEEVLKSSDIPVMVYRHAED